MRGARNTEQTLLEAIRAAIANNRHYEKQEGES